MNKNEIFTESFSSGKRTYFFDLKQTITGNMYLSIAESKIINNTKENFKILVFEEDVDQFVQSFRNLLIEYKKEKQNQKKASKQIDTVKVKAYTLEEKRLKNKNAYEPWTKEEDELLKQKYWDNIPIKEIAKYFERSKNAIESRIKKLNL